MAASSRFTCACGTNYAMGTETTIQLYLKQAWLNHLTTVCPQCKSSSTVWGLTEAATTAMMTQMEPADPITLQVTDYATDEIWKANCLATGRPFWPDRFISPRAQARIDAEVAFAAWDLAQGESVDQF